MSDEPNLPENGQGDPMIAGNAGDVSEELVQPESDDLAMAASPSASDSRNGSDAPLPEADERIPDSPSQGKEFADTEVHGQYQQAFQQRPPSISQGFQSANYKINNIKNVHSRNTSFESGAAIGTMFQTLHIMGQGEKVRDKGPRLIQLSGLALQNMVQRFVMFDEYKTVHQVCQDERIIIIQSQDELLAQQISLHMVYEGLRHYIDNQIDADKIPAFRVNLRHSLNDFKEDYPEEYHQSWFLLLNAPEQAFSISSLDLEMIKRNLEEFDSYLVITVRPTTNIPANLLGRCLFNQIRQPDPRLVIFQAIRTSNNLTEHGEAQWLINALHQEGEQVWADLLAYPRELKDIYVLAEEIIFAWKSDPTNKQVLSNFLTQSQQREIEAWFNRHKDWRIRAYMIALCVFDGASPEEVLTGYRYLLELMGLDEPENRPHRSEMFAGLYYDYEEMENGTIRRIQTLRFNVQGLYGLVLYHIWQDLYGEQNPYLESIIMWLRVGLIETSYTNRMRQLAARAIGTLAIQNFAFIEDRIIKFVIQAMSKQLGENDKRAFSEQIVTALWGFLIDGIDTEDISDEQRQQLKDVVEERIEAILIAEKHKANSLEIALIIADAMGNMLAYSIQSGHPQMRNEALRLIQELSTTSKQSRQLWHSYIQLQVTLSFYFYAGAGMVERAEQDLRRIASETSEDLLDHIAKALRQTVVSIIINRLRLPGDPRPDIGRLLALVREWMMDSKKSNPKLRYISLNIFSQLAIRITEPYTQTSREWLAASPLQDLPYADFPLLTFLSLQSSHADKMEDNITEMLRFIISKNDVWPSSSLYWVAYLCKQLDRDIPKEPWTIRDHGFAILEYWMMFVEGRSQSDKPRIKKVQDKEEYVTHLRRLVIGIIAWIPSDATRERMLIRLQKMFKRNPCVQSIAEELYDFIYDHTDSVGNPR